VELQRFYVAREGMTTLSSLRHTYTTHLFERAPATFYFRPVFAMDINGTLVAPSRRGGPALMKPTFPFVVVTLVLATVGSTAAAGEKKSDLLTVTLSSYVSNAESDVIVRARVERDTRSRVLTIEWVSDDLSGGLHSVPLEGASAAVAHDYRIKRMPPGQYIVTTTLRLDDGKEVRRALNLTVIGRDGSGGMDPRVTGASAGGRSRRGLWD
jgi:hypothetical protein